MSAPSGRRNNILAGIFLLGSLGVGVALSFMLSGIADSWGSYTKYTIWFPLSVGAPGIKPGSPVNLGGQGVGRVDRVRREMIGEMGPRILLDVSIESDLVVYPDAKAYLEQPLLGTLSAINIRWLGGIAAGPALSQGGSIKGGVAPPSFLEAAGFGPEEQDKVKTIVQQVEDILTQFQTSLKTTDEQIQPILKQAQEISAEVESMVTRISAELDGWTGEIDLTLANVRAGSERIDPLLAEAQTLLEDAEAVLASAQSAIDDNRDEIDRIIANVEATTQTVNEQTLPLVNGTIEEYRAPAADLAAVVSDARTLMAQEIPNLRRTIANLRLASDQLKLTIGEVRQAPWRLLERPTTRELQAQLYYDATRAFAEAVSDLRAASESLTAARASGAASPEALQGLLDQLEEAFQTYQRAETRMLEQIPRTQP